MHHIFDALIYATHSCDQWWLAFQWWNRQDCTLRDTWIHCWWMKGTLIWLFTLPRCAYVGEHTRQRMQRPHPADPWMLSVPRPERVLDGTLQTPDSMADESYRESLCLVSLMFVRFVRLAVRRKHLKRAQRVNKDFDIIYCCRTHTQSSCGFIAKQQWWLRQQFTSERQTFLLASRQCLPFMRMPNSGIYASQQPEFAQNLFH